VRAAASSEDRGMNNEHPWQALIELDLRCDPIGGCVRDAQGHGSQFSGWLGLIGAINQLREAARAPAARAVTHQAPPEAPLGTRERKQ
jgi:hypothetical protein